MFPANSFAGKTVALFGLARSGLACAEALRLGGAQVAAWDDTAAARDKAGAEGVTLMDLTTADFREFAALILSPGVPLTHPQPHWTVTKAKGAGIEVIGDAEVFAREIRGSGARMVGITGTNGKSTTTALIGHVLAAAGCDVDVGGNIGKAVFLLRPPQPGRIYVLELSSFQIDLMPGLAPDAGILLNITPDHLDRHGTMEGYAAVKARMFARQSGDATAIVGVDDEWSEQIATSLTAPALVPISVLRDLETGVSAPDGVLRAREKGRVTAEIDLRAISSLRGRHNWQNACAAYAAARAMGVTDAAIASAMASFPGLAHRMEEVGRIGPVSFINDSKATNADAAARALASFERIYWIAGGLAKAGGIAPLAEYFPRIRHAYLIGAAAEEFARTLDGSVAWSNSGTLDAALAAATRDALAAGEDAAVLLSPACASFDQYSNFEVRGDAFRAAVTRIVGEGR